MNETEPISIFDESNVHLWMVYDMSRSDSCKSRPKNKRIMVNLHERPTRFILIYSVIDCANLSEHFCEKCLLYLSATLLSINEAIVGIKIMSKY